MSDDRAFSIDSRHSMGSFYHALPEPAQSDSSSEPEAGGERTSELSRLLGIGKRDRAASRRHVYLYSFAVCLENIIVFPSMWPRLQRMAPHGAHSELGWAMAAFSLARAVSALAINAVPSSPRNTVAAGVFCFCCSMMGGFLYVVAATPWELIGSRAVAGLGAGALSLMIRTLVSLSTEEKRTEAMSNFYLAAALGEITGPALTALTTDLSYNVLGQEIDQYNCAGLYTMAVFTFAFLFMSRSYATVSEFEPKGTEPLSWSVVTPRLAILFAMGVITNFSVASWETATVPLAMRFFDWGVEANSWFFVVAGCVLFLVNIVFVRVAERFRWTDAHGLLIGVGVATLGGSLLATSLSASMQWWFCLSNALYVMGVFSLLTFVSSMFTKQLVSHAAFFIGAFRSAGALSRVAGNVFAAATLSPSFAFSARALLCSTGVALVLLLGLLYRAVKQQRLEFLEAVRDPVAEDMAAFEGDSDPEEASLMPSEMFPDRRDSFSSQGSSRPSFSY